MVVQIGILWIFLSRAKQPKSTRNGASKKKVGSDSGGRGSLIWDPRSFGQRGTMILDQLNNNIYIIYY